LRPYRQGESKRRAFSNFRVDPDSATVHLDDALRDRKAESGAALLSSDGVVGLLEVLE
jgi:hypothetical protein